MPYISDSELNKLRLDVEIMRSELEAAQNREEKLIAEMKNLQSMVNRLNDEIDRMEFVQEVKGLR